MQSLLEHKNRGANKPLIGCFAPIIAFHVSVLLKRQLQTPK
jgi:hypothetical protein